MRDVLIGQLPFEPQYREALRQLAPDFDFYFTEDGPVPDEAWENAVVILGGPSAAELAKCRKLRWVQLGSAGVDFYCRPGVLPESVMLTNATGSYGHAISEYMVGATLMVMKNLHLYRDNQATGAWLDRGNVKSVTSSKVLVIGMGDIGGEYARRMHALGASVTGITRTPREKPVYADRMGLLGDLDALLPEYDVVAMALPNTAETVGLMDVRRLSLMKKGAILVNVGRGSAVDTEALCDVLESGHLQGAVLDVTAPEPLPSDHRLWHIPGAVITPHISGGYHMRETYENIMAIFTENLGRFVRGEELGHQVDRSTGYMKK